MPNPEKSSVPHQLPQAKDEVPIFHFSLAFDTDLPRGSQEHTFLEPAPPDLHAYASPFTWSSSRKSITMTIGYAITLVTSYSTGAYSSGSDQLARQFARSHTIILTGITAYAFGFGLAPMLLAPFSEIKGRYPVFVITSILFLVCQLCCAVTQSFAGLLLARFFLGVGGSTGASMVGGLVADMYYEKDRNTPMSLFAGSALLGTGLGPFVSGFIAQNLPWRYIFYLQLITGGLLVLAIIFFMRESRGAVLLHRKAEALNRWYETREMAGYKGFEMSTIEKGMTQSRRIRWKVDSYMGKEPIERLVGISVYRSFHLLFTEPVVFFFSLWISFAWAVLFLTFSAIPFVFTASYGFNVAETGAIFAAICIGVVLSTLLSIFQDQIASKLYMQVTSTPEGRLYFSCVESTLLPIGLFWFAWTISPNFHWIIPTIAIGCSTMGIYSIYLAVFSYFANVYHRYASSAIAAQSFCRNILAGVLPLATSSMFTRLTFAGAGSLLGGIAAVLTLVPWVLVFYGPRIRARSKFASEIVVDS